MQKIIIDTNMLLAQFEFGVDVPSELERIVHAPISLLVPSGTMGELSSHAGRTGKKAAAARFVLSNLAKLHTRFQLEVAPSEGRVDDWILKYAQSNPVIVATNDVPLRRRLLAAGVKVIAVKGKSKLDFV